MADFDLNNAVPKIHPATREALPDDPMEMHGFEVPGDPELMLRMLVEEYTRMGWGVDALMSLAKDPNYTAFYAFRKSLGDDGLRQALSRIIAHEIGYKEFAEILEDFMNTIDCWVEEAKNFK